MPCVTRSGVLGAGSAGVRLPLSAGGLPAVADGACLCPPADGDAVAGAGRGDRLGRGAPAALPTHPTADHRAPAPLHGGGRAHSRSVRGGTEGCGTFTGS